MASWFYKKNKNKTEEINRFLNNMEETNNQAVEEGDESLNKTVRIKKGQDELVEKITKKRIITEDNRELLKD